MSKLVKMEDVFEERRSSDLSEALLLKAKDELGETDELREEAVIILKEWIETHKHDYSNLGEIKKQHIYL